MNNPSCCNHADTNEDKSSCCSHRGNSACCGKQAMTASEVIDPVCKMELDPSETKLTVEHEGETYYFCNIACKDNFVRDPEKYLGKAHQ